MKGQRGPKRVRACVSARMCACGDMRLSCPRESRQLRARACVYAPEYSRVHPNTAGVL
jgi:hypothetical protein